MDCKQIGQRVRQTRKDAGMSQLELATMAGVGINFVSQLERGKPTLRLDKVLDVLRVLGLEIEIRDASA